MTRAQRKQSRLGQVTVAVLALALLVAVVLVALQVVRQISGAGNTVRAETEAVEAAPLEPEPLTPPLDFSGFNAENIISDEDFFNVDAYSEAEVAQFISTWNKGCREGIDGAPCLADYVEDTSSYPADEYCPDGFAGRKGDTAASIIWRAAQSCGINPQVLLTTLQKEQGLITSSGLRLNETRYAIAMGYACPDSSNCDKQFFGFANQVYHGARQMRIYEQRPEIFLAAPGQTVMIPYSPDPACGGTELFISNQATANLYNYTPYQPNKAALVGGPGPCSSVGNLNFYAYFNAWFKAG